MPDKKIDRRDFLKTLGGGAAATLAVAAGCGHPNATTGEAFASEAPTGKMTYRLDTHGEPVSLIGYGCMRLPVVGGGSARRSEAEIDQEELNRHVDYAIEHGVNYFDTSPV